MRYLRWLEKDIAGIASVGLASIWTEVDADGRVVREIGFDANGRSVLGAPTAERARGLFDNVTVALERNDEDELEPSLFEEAWHRFNQQGESSFPTPELPRPQSPLRREADPED